MDKFLRPSVNFVKYINKNEGRYWNTFSIRTQRFTSDQKSSNHELLNCSVPSREDKTAHRFSLAFGNSKEVQKYQPKFMDARDRIFNDLIHFSDLDDIPEAKSRLTEFLNEYFLAWNYVRGPLMIYWYFEYLKERNQDIVNTEELEHLFTLSWCFIMCEIFLVGYDDIIDNSEIRLGKKTWFLEKDRDIATSYDFLLLYGGVRVIINKYFANKENYYEIQKLFTHVNMGAAWSIFLDTAFVVHYDKKPVMYDWCTLDMYRSYSPAKIYPIMMTPLRLVQLLINEPISTHDTVILSRYDHWIGGLIQAWDDYLDVYAGDMETGDSQNDISEGRMTYLFVTALEHCNDAQRQLLMDNYGYSDPKKIEIVKKVYNELDMKSKVQIYEKQLVRIMDEEIDNVENTALKRNLRFLTHNIHNIHY